MDPRTRLLLEAPIGGSLLRLAAPNVLVMLAQASVGLIETWFVAKLGTDSLAGMAFVFPVLMLVTMIAAGAMGGGILSAVARALGSGRTAFANDLVWHATALAVALGLATSLLAHLVGAPLYALMGGTGESLRAAVTYSDLLFAGAVFLWLFNSLAAVIRGTGNMVLPASVIVGGTVVLVPLSPLLIFGYGPLPALGIVGGAVAVILYYIVGTAVFAAYLWSGRGVLHPTARPPAFAWAPMRDILRIGAVSSLVSATTNITIATATAFAGTIGPAAAAGYGTGARLEYLLVPLVFGLGAPIGAMVGTSIGAGQTRRALRTAIIGAAFATALTEVIGLAAALFPEAWLGLFGQDPQMLAVGSQYLRIVGPFYGFYGLGLALYFASQGAGRLAWPLIAGLVRLVVSIGGGWLALRAGLGATGIYAGLCAGLVTFGLVNVAGLMLGSFGQRSAPGKLALKTR